LYPKLLVSFLAVRLLFFAIDVIYEKEAAKEKKSNPVKILKLSRRCHAIKDSFFFAARILILQFARQLMLL
jgi:hypothetical protein